MKRKISKLVKAMLKEGMSLKRISLCIALGATLGVFPVLGMTTLLCTAAAFLFRLNLPAIQVVNFMVYPLQIVLLVPFYGTGNWLFQQQKLHLIKEDLIGLFAKDFWGSMVNLWDLTLYAIVSWLIVSPFLVLLLYGILKSVMRAMAISYDRIKPTQE
ncbi:MAG: DUF2062 domain-containing protein [Desulfobacterales bacterium]